MKEHLSAPGQLNQWVTGSGIALENGEFTKIKLNRAGDRMTAKYGADSIAIDFGIKDQAHVYLRIESTDNEVLQWFKACVSDVMLHPERYGEMSGEGEDDESAFDEPQTEPVYAYPQNQEPAGSQQGSSLPQSQKAEKEQLPFKERFKRTLPKTWFMILMLIIFPPYGFYLLYHYKKFDLVRRILVTIVAAAYFLFIWLGFLGVNTGVNQDSVSAWIAGLKNQSSQSVTTAPTPTVEDGTE